MKAVYATTTTRNEHGRWAVYVLVLFDDQTGVYKRITDYHTSRKADIAATIIEKTINRYDEKPPFGGWLPSNGDSQ